MSVVTKLIGAWAVGKSISNTTPLLVRLMAGMVALVVCAAFTAVITTLLLLGISWFCYSAMVDSGMENAAAFLIILAVWLALLLAFVLIIKAKLQGIKRVGNQLSFMNSPLSTRVSHITDAFLQGLMNEKPRNDKMR